MAVKTRISISLTISSIAMLTLLSSSNIKPSAIGGYSIAIENVSKLKSDRLTRDAKKIGRLNNNLLIGTKQDGSTKPHYFPDICLTAAASWKTASFPVENFQTYTSLFGYRQNPVTGKKQYHSGVDLAAPLGSSVLAWWDGTIVKLSDHTACGTSVTIASGNWQHIYCHLKGSVTTDRTGTYLIDRSGGIQFKLGQKVSTGTRIGRVGVTGRTTPHLHWGVKYQGKYVDPALLLEQTYQQQQYQ